jgi:hypothetical protein
MTKNGSETRQVTLVIGHDPLPRSQEDKIFGKALIMILICTIGMVILTVSLSTKEYMNEITLLFREIQIEEVIGTLPKLRFRIDISVKTSPEIEVTRIHLNRISFDVDLHSARDPSTSVKEGYLGTFDSLELVTLQQFSAYVEFCIPITSLIMQKMLDIRNIGSSIAFKINATAAGINYLKTQDSCTITSIWQSQMIVFQNIPAGNINLVLISREQF